MNLELFSALLKKFFIFCTLDTISGMLVHCLGLSAGLTEINSSLVSPLLGSLPLDCQWQVAEPGLFGSPGALEPLNPGHS